MEDLKLAVALFCSIIAVVLIGVTGSMALYWVFVNLGEVVGLLIVLFIACYVMAHFANSSH